MAGFQFSVSWGAYQKNICNGLSSLQQSGKFVDMTIAADGHHVKVHQMVMSLVSPYIEDLIASASCPHPVIFLNSVSYQTLQSILQYAYTGEVVIPRDQITIFLDACKALHIRGTENLKSTDQDLENIECVTTDQYINSENMEIDTKPSVKQHNNLTSDNYDVMNAAFDGDSPNNSENEAKPFSYSPTSQNKLTKLQSDALEKINSLSANTKTKLDQSIQLQYSVSNQGKIQLICNRYVYFLASARKSGERMWRCVTYRNNCMCRAFLVTKDTKIIRRVGVHNHPFHDKIILKRLNNGNIFSALNDVESHIVSMKNMPIKSASESE